MRTLQIHDRDERGCLVFDLRDVLAAIGSLADELDWRCLDVECTGETASMLHNASGLRTIIDGPALRAAASNLLQTIDGEFLGYRPGEQEPIVTIRAIDSSYWEIEGSETVCEYIRARFADVRSASAGAA